MPRLANRASQATASRRVPDLRTWWLTGLVCTTLLMLAGCSRSFWRQNADDNTYAILQDKASDPRWAPPRLDLQPDPRSRFFDPYDPDCEPLPPDDPTAHAYMHWMGRNTGVAKVDQPWTGGVLPPCLYPQKPIRGWKSWHQFGDTLTVENPQWLENFGLTPEQLAEQQSLGAPQGPGIANLTLAQAIELSYIHSRDFQLQLENLYSTSLALTFERFRFDVRYLGLGGRKPGASLVRSQSSGTESATLNSHLGISQLLPTGGQWIVDMANNTLWLFTGGNQSSTATTLSYSLVQPLLLGAGRQIVLESLTQAERLALYAMRDFARFRQVFFVNTISGGSSGGAYYGLQQQYQVILNARFNIKLLEINAIRQQALSKERSDELKEPLPPIPMGQEDVYKLPVLPERYAGRLRYEPALNDLRWNLQQGPMTAQELAELKQLIQNPALQDALEELYAVGAAGNALSLDVAQLLTQLAQSRSQLLSNERQFQDSLDRYKFQLGLPPDLWVTLDVGQLRPFQLISPELITLEGEVTQFAKRMESLPEQQIVSDELQTVTNDLKVLTTRVTDQGLKLLEADRDSVQRNKDYRFESLPPTFDDNYRKSILDDYERDNRLIDIIHAELGRLSKRLDALKEELKSRAAEAKAKPAAKVKPEQKPKPEDKAKPEEPPKDRIDVTQELADIREGLVKLVQNMEVVQINLRVELISLNKFDMAIDEVVQTGLENRVDLMNQRAIVMDARRKMEVAANTLRSQLDVTAAGEINTVPLGAGSTSPFEFRRDQSNFRLGVAFTAPLDQVQQRNIYRQSLITYQQARRQYMAAEDQVKLDVRTAWRQLNALKQQFEITRKNVRLAAMTYDQAVERSLQPTTAGQGGGGGSSSTNGLQLIQALNSVLSAQNNLIQFWINYEVNRLNIHRDMGIMQLDERGVWIDDYYQKQFDALPVTSDVGARTEGMEVPEVETPAPSPSLPPLTPAMP